VSILCNITNGTVVASAVRNPTTTWRRMVGLIGARELAPSDGMWLEPCSTIHTMGMRFPIDVVLLNSEGRVVAIAPNVPPLRPFVSHRSTAIVVELPAGSAAQSVRLGDELVLVNEDETAGHIAGDAR
jgi:uncharacterized membrane protein (UPF0127 family)